MQDFSQTNEQILKWLGLLGQPRRSSGHFQGVATGPHNKQQKAFVLSIMKVYLFTWCPVQLVKVTSWTYQCVTHTRVGGKEDSWAATSCPVLEVLSTSSKSMRKQGPVLAPTFPPCLFSMVLWVSALQSLWQSSNMHANIYWWYLTLRSAFDLVEKKINKKTLSNVTNVLTRARSEISVPKLVSTPNAKSAWWWENITLCEISSWKVMWTTCVSVCVCTVQDIPHSPIAF